MELLAGNSVHKIILLITPEILFKLQARMRG